MDNHHGNLDTLTSADCQSKEEGDCLDSTPGLSGDCQSPETEYKETCSPTVMAAVRVGNLFIPTGNVEVSFLCLSRYAMAPIVGAGA